MKWTECTVSSPCPGVLPLSRSSHGISIIGDRLFMFGGEHEARTPVGSEVWALDLKTDGGMEWRALKAQGEPPSPRSVITYSLITINQFILNSFSQGLVTASAPWAPMFTSLEEDRELPLTRSF